MSLSIPAEQVCDVDRCADVWRLDDPFDPKLGPWTCAACHSAPSGDPRVEWCSSADFSPADRPCSLGLDPHGQQSERERVADPPCSLRLDPHRQTQTQRQTQNVNSYVDGKLTVGEQLPGEKRGGAESKKRVYGIFDPNTAMYRVLKEWRAGMLVPEFEVPLALDRIAPQAHTLRALAEALASTMGLWLTLGETGAMPVSRSWTALLMGLDPVRDVQRAAKLLHALERADVIRQDGALDPLGKADGTRCFQPFDYDLVSLFEPHPQAVPDIEREEQAA